MVACSEYVNVRSGSVKGRQLFDKLMFAEGIYSIELFILVQFLTI
jgi:hypothetical protein